MSQATTFQTKLAEALRADAQVALFFDSLSHSRNTHLALPIEDAKTPETHQRRIAKAVALLREKRV